MDNLLSDQELNLILKSIGTRMDWLNIEKDRHVDMIRNPLLAQYKETNASVHRKIEDQLASLRLLRKRLLTDPPLRTQAQMMHVEER